MNDTSGYAPATRSILATARERGGGAVRLSVDARSLPAAFENAESESRVPVIAEVKPTSPTTDGGTVHVADPDSTDDKTQAREGPDDCGCWDPDGDFPVGLATERALLEDLGSGSSLTSHSVPSIPWKVMTASPRE